MKEYEDGKPIIEIARDKKASPNTIRHRISKQIKKYGIGEPKLDYRLNNNSKGEEHEL